MNGALISRGRRLRRPDHTAELAELSTRELSTSPREVREGGRRATTCSAGGPWPEGGRKNLAGGCERFFERARLALPGLRRNLDVLHAWRVSEGPNVGAFSPKQAEFLDHHRTEVFRDGQP